MEHQGNLEHREDSAEGIDFDKLKAVFRRNFFWFIGIFILTNTLAYLAIRWTKPVYESHSLLRLDVAEQTNIFGITPFEDNHANLLASEIELIRSKLFLNKVIQTMGLDISYFAVGEMLVDEKFGSTPIIADIEYINPSMVDRPVYVEILSKSTYQAKVGEQPDSSDPIYKFGDKITWDDIRFRLYVTSYYEQYLPTTSYFFVRNSNESLLAYLTDNLSVDYDNINANTIRIAFTDHNAQKAHKLVNAIDTIYLKYTDQKKNQENERKIEWLDSELNKIEQQLTNYETYFENFTIENRSSNLNEDLNVTIIQMNRLDSQRYSILERIRDVEELKQRVALGIKESLLEVNPEKYPKFIVDTFEELQLATLDLENVSLSYNKNTFAYSKKLEAVETLKNTLSGQFDILKERLTSDLARVNQERSRLEETFTQMPEKNTEFNKNSRYYSLYEEFYLTLMQSKAEFQIAKAGTENDFIILSPASLPKVPISPNVPIIHGIGIVAGLVISLFVLGILYLLHNKITSLKELERLTKHPILGVIPRAREKLNATQLIVDKKPKSAISESLRTIRTNIDFMIRRTDTQLISVTSTVGGEGKTFLSVNLGGILALSGKKVCLLDLDMRKPRVHDTFEDVNMTSGISTILIGKNTIYEMIRSTNMQNLDYIPAGPTPPNPSELLLGESFEMLLDELKQMYDVILMDTPPVGLVTDGMLAMKKADLSLYVVRANYSQRKFINTLNKLRKDTHYNTLAVILNALPESGSNSYGYGYYEEKKDESVMTRV
jgi:capsular exopolysaccharide synthesis family protein